MKKIYDNTICGIEENLGENLIDRLYQELKQTAVFALSGPLGAGKTTLVQGLLARAGITDSIQSPTYTYVIPYTAPDGTIFYHFDLYRLNSLEDFVYAGFDEYLFQPGSKALIEWPEIIKPLLTHDTCFIELDYESASSRRISAFRI